MSTIHKKIFIAALISIFTFYAEIIENAVISELLKSFTAS